MSTSHPEEFLLENLLNNGGGSFFDFSVGTFCVKTHSNNLIIHAQRQLLSAAGVELHFYSHFKALSRFPHISAQPVVFCGFFAQFGASHTILHISQIFAALLTKFAAQYVSSLRKVWHRTFCKILPHLIVACVSLCSCSIPPNYLHRG